VPACPLNRMPRSYAPPALPRGKPRGVGLHLRGERCDLIRRGQVQTVVDAVNLNWRLPSR
jgi:hypothetical protein